MKKSFLCIGLFFVALISCTNNEVIDVPQEKNAIQFKAPFVGKNTRATDANEITTNDVNHIHVFGKFIASDATTHTGATDVFNNVKLDKSGNLYATDQEWQANKLYSFAAYIDGKNGQNQTGATFALTSTTTSALTIPNYIVSNNDLVVAMPEDVRTTTNSNYAVPLIFNHTLSKVRFTFENGESSTFNMTVSDIKIDGAWNQGTLIVSKSAGGVVSPDWKFEDSHSRTGYTFSSTSLIVPKGTDYTEGFVIPQNIERLNVTFKITLEDTDKNTSETMNYTASLALALSSWTAHRAYNYKLSIAAHDIDSDLSDKIQFKLDYVDSWGTYSDKTLEPTQKGNL